MLHGIVSLITFIRLARLALTIRSKRGAEPSSTSCRALGSLPRGQGVVGRKYWEHRQKIELTDAAHKEARLTDTDG